LLLQARKYLITHSTGTVTIARAMMGKWKKRAKTVYTQQREMKKQILRFRLQQKEDKLYQRTQ
jgi:hypothetical protein